MQPRRGGHSTTKSTPESTGLEQEVCIASGQGPELLLLLLVGLLGLCYISREPFIKAHDTWLVIRGKMTSGAAHIWTACLRGTVSSVTKVAVT